jgi:predicted  nucleic acid-binding Zn-ribbon protein
LNEQLKTLYQIQKLDTKIIGNERKRASAPERIQEMEREMAEASDKALKEEEIIDELDRERRRKEKELEVEKEKIKKAQAKLYEVKTNKEYQALLKEIEVAQAANDKTEEEIILLLERVEDLKREHEELSSRLKTRQKEVGVEKKQIEEEIKSVDEVINVLNVEKQKLLEHLDSEVIQRYEVLIERRGGVAVVSARSGVCLGCHMNIPPQLFIEVTKNFRFITCPSCNRIFYYAEDEEQE